MTAESMAARRARRLEPDWVKSTEDLRNGLVSLSGADGAAELDAMLTEYAATGEGQRSPHPLGGLVEEVARDLVEAMVSLGADPDRMGLAHVVPTLREDVSAEMRPFDDGSGLIVISDAMLSLCVLYCRCLGVALDHIASRGRLRGFLRSLRVAATGNTGVPTEVVTGLLRYYYVNQRVFGIAAQLELRVSRGAERIAALLMVHATRFVIGHELAHHALGHDSPHSGFSPGEHLPACSADQDRELAADELAHRAADRVATTENDHARSLPMALLGGLVAMLAVHATEEALFVRRGASHPPARLRADLLFRQADDEQRNFGRLFFVPLLAATDEAAVFAPGAEVFDLARTLASPLVHTVQPLSELKPLSVWDACQCLSEDRMVEVVSHKAPGSASLAKGAHHASAGNAGDALRCWAVPEETVTRLLDPRFALTFHSLVEIIRAGLTASGVEQDARLVMSIVAARLVAPALATTG